MPVIHFDAQRQRRGVARQSTAAAIAARQAQGARELIAFAKTGQIGPRLLISLSRSLGVSASKFAGMPYGQKSH